jgi:FSR family fosmidomycin resistance protein-like MFS transporter
MVNDKRLLWAISFHHLCNDGTLLALVALLPVLVVEMNISYYDVGLLGFGLVITVVFQYAVGKYADRAISKYLLETGAALMALAFMLLLLVNDFPGLFAAVIVMRVGAAFYHPVGTSWISRAFKGPYLDTALGVQSGVGNFGVIIALATSGYLGEAFGWKVPCAIWALLNSAAVLIGMLVIKDGGPKLPSGTRAARIGSRVTLGKIGILALPIMTGGALYQVTSYFGPLNLTRHTGWTAGSADLIFAFWIGIGTITSYSYGRISARYDRRSILKAAYLVSAASAMLLSIATLWYFVAPVLLAFGALLYLTYPALFAHVTAATKESERGTAFGILFGFQLGGGAATVYLCGIIADALGNPSYSFLVVAGLALLSVVALLIWERRNPNAQTGARETD